jgi:AcrR family transcriptional regulator
MIAAILDAARAVMREHGVAALNLQDVAARVGMRAPSLYTYFASKIAIYEALYVMGMRMYRERLGKVLQTHGMTWGAIQGAITNYMDFAHEHPELYQLLFERPVPGFVPSAEGNEEARKLIETSNDAIARMMQAGVLAPNIPAEQASLLLVALMQGLTAMHIANEPQTPVASSIFGNLIPAAMALLRAGWASEPDRG